MLLNTLINGNLDHLMFVFMFIMLFVTVREADLLLYALAPKL